ncbi:hypothetical protein MHZ93_06110 [Roseomonas sp. ACRSG]|nr:hypothetical protein [Roseomonas sp. ACRSG]
MDIPDDERKNALTEWPGPFASTDPEQIWHQSPLKLDAMRRIFASVGIELLPEGAEVSSAYLALAHMVTTALILSTQKPAALQKQKVAAVKAYVDLLSALIPVMHTPGGPPAPPTDWLKAMDQWSKDLHLKPSKAGTRKDAVSNFLIPMVLALYRVIFDRDPSSGETGPTIRFMMAIYEEMEKAVTGTIFEPPGNAERAKAAWICPSKAAMQKRIRDLAPMAKEKESLVDDLIYRLYTKLQEGAPKH